MGFILFACAVLYVVSKRIGLLKLQRTVTAAIKAGMVKEPQLRPGAAIDDINIAHDNLVPNVEQPLEQGLHDEL